MRTQLLLAAIVLGAIPLADCHCGSDTLTQNKPGMCNSAYKCMTGFEYRLGECKQARCITDTDCCPGQKCNASAGFCADQFVACTDDTQCTEVAGQTCIDFRGSKFCGFPNKGHALSQQQTQACLTTGDCDTPRTCFGGRCVTEAPCNGGCPSGSICDIDTNSCYPFPTCAMSCGDGQMLIVADQDTESGAHCCKVDCKCETLPPIPPGQYGYYASLGITKENVVVSAYDQTYGDLVVAHFGLDGIFSRLEYVDGLPTSGKIVGNPNGARGGRTDPGPDVGQHTSLVVDAQNVTHIAYYDKTNGQLKYANDAGGKWNISLVDMDGNVGQYTSIAIAPDGNPRIAYMLVEGTRPPDTTKITALKYATAHSATPAGPMDWDVVYVDTKAKPIPPCNGSCPMGQSCIDMMGMGAPQCIADEMGCMPACASNEACIDKGGTPTCVAKIPLLAIDDLIPGTGLFASLAITSTGTPKIAYYDRIAGDLRYAVGAGPGRFSVVTLDGNEPMNPTDVGQHASIAIDPNGVVGIAYVDSSKSNLVYMSLPPGMMATREVVDNGVSAPDIRMVGPDASLLFDPNGNPAIAYQDPTNIDLLYARRTGTPPMWSTEVLKGGPGRAMMGMMPRGTASGFYASQRRTAAKAFISNVDVTFDPEGNLILGLSVVLKNLQ